MTDIDLQDKPSTSTKGASSSPADRDWKETAKGLQRANDKLTAQLQAALDRAAGFEEQVTTLREAHRDDARTWQDEKAALERSFKEKETALSSLTTERDTLAKTAAQLSQEREIRQSLVKSGNADLLPFFESGYLSPGERQGEELETYLTGFRGMLGQQLDKKVDDTLKGSTPPVFNSGEKQTKLTPEQYMDWLMTHDESDPNYATYQEAYYDSVKS